MSRFDTQLLCRTSCRALSWRSMLHSDTMQQRVRGYFKQSRVLCLGQWISAETDEEATRNQLETVKSNRRGMMLQYHRYPSAEYKIAGVSFNNRQSILERVRSNDAILFEREPYNAYDSNAVRISLLDGSRLGYVPRDQTSAFGAVSTAGRVKSVGLGKGGYYGASAFVQPRLPYLLPAFLPDDLSHLIDPFDGISHAEKTHLLQYFEKRGKTSCCLTGSTADLYPLLFWRAHNDIKSFEVSWIDLIDREFVSVAHMSNGNNELELSVLANINGWTIDEVGLYVQSCSERREFEEWTADITELTRFLKEAKIPSLQASMKKWTKQQSTAD